MKFSLIYSFSWKKISSISTLLPYDRLHQTIGLSTPGLLSADSAKISCTFSDSTHYDVHVCSKNTVTQPQLSREDHGGMDFFFFHPCSILNLKLELKILIFFCPFRFFLSIKAKSLRKMNFCFFLSAPFFFVH